MRLSKPRFLCLVLGLLTLVLVMVTTRSQAFGVTESVLWSFGNGTDGALPDAGLIMDVSGNLYGTTETGGASGGGFDRVGTVFKLTPERNESVLWSFGVGTDGALPFAGLIMDTSGNLYGTTYLGGASNGGTVFQLTPQGNESLLWNFASGVGGGAFPAGALIMDTSGNLYGTTSSGGTSNGLAGTVFKLTPQGNESVLWSFGDGTDGFGPNGDLTMDTSGNFYGTTFLGGASNRGTVFKLTAPSIIGGNWNESVLWSFGNGTDGANPEAGLIMDPSGNLYSTTAGGGAYGGGTVFKLTSDGTESVLWSFGNGADGASPAAGLIMDASGNLYGTTRVGGTYGRGTVFKLTSAGTESVLWNFGNDTDGVGPVAGLIMDTSGNLYGTTRVGGTYGRGTVFEISDVASAPQITVKPMNLVFPSTKIKSTSLANLRVNNTGTAQLIGTVNTPPAPFGLHGSGSFNLAPGAHAIFTLTFTPTAKLQARRMDTVVSNAVDQSTVQLKLEGTGTP